MQRYFDVVQTTAGNAIPGALVYVYVGSTTVLATLFSDNGVTAAPNPLTTNADGEYAFYAANGTYTLQIAATGYAGETKPGVVLFDPSDAGIISVKDFGAKGDGVSDDTAAIQAAVTHAQVTGNTLFVPAGTYLVSSVTVGSGLHIVGQHSSSSVFKQTAIGSAIFCNYDSTTKTNIYFENIGLNSNSKDSGINIRNVINLTARSCEFINHPAWGILVGITEDAVNTTTITCSDILIENCRFSNSLQTFEHIAVFNAKNVVVRDCYFELALTGGIGIGLWQNLYGVTIDSCEFTNITKGIYYSVTTNEISITNCRFTAVTIGIQGANESDWGLFGESWMRGLNISNCYFQDCAIGCEIGAVFDCYLGGNHFVSNRENALIITYGNRLSTPTISQSVNITIVGCHFLNNNSDNTFHSIHPAVLFTEGGGQMYTTFVGCTFTDTQVTPTQWYPVSFVDYSFSKVRFIGCRLTAYSAGSSIGIFSATLSDIELVSCMDVTGALPNGVTNLSVSGIADYANDSAAGAGGVSIGSIYRTGSILKIRVT
jgi:hypothetical protein